MRIKSLLSLLLCATPSLFAAQNARVIKDGAEIHQLPAASSGVLETKKIGDILRISNSDKDRWYKTKTSTGKFGWIQQSDIEPTHSMTTSDTQLHKEFETQEIDSSRFNSAYDRNWHLKFAADSFFLMSPRFSQRLGRSPFHPYFAPLITAEGGYRIQDALSVVLRTGYYITSGEITDRSGYHYQYTHEGIPFLLGLDREFSTNGKWSMHAALYFGMSFNNQLFIRARDYTLPNSTLLKANAFAWALIFSGHYSLSTRWKLFLETGGVFTYSPKVPMTNFNGSEVFRNGSSTLSLPIQNFGPVLGAGLLVSI